VNDLSAVRTINEIVVEIDNLLKSEQVKNVQNASVDYCLGYSKGISDMINILEKINRRFG